MKVFTKRINTANSSLVVFLFSLFLILSVKDSSAQVVSSGGPDAWSSSAINGDGTLFVWGFDQYNHPVQIKNVIQDSVPVMVAFPNGSAVTAWTAVVNAPGFLMALGNDGNVYAWGRNGKGQLGDGTTNDSNMPVKVLLPAGVTATAIAVGDSNGYALCSDGNIYAWGLNNYGELGNGTTNSSENPIPAAITKPNGITSWKAIASGSNFAYAIGNNDSLYAWGRNANAQLGIRSTVDQYTPVSVVLPNGVIPISPLGGQSFGGCIASDGNIYLAGRNNNGELCNGTTGSTGVDTMAAIIKPTGVTSWKQASLGSKFGMAVANNDTLFAWGQGGTGQLGNGGSVGANPTTVLPLLPSGSTAVSIATGNTHAYMADQNGNVFAWGNNKEGENGINNIVSTKTPTQTVGLGGVGFLSLTTANAPSVPTLSGPADNAVNLQLPVVISWDNVSGATQYIFQVSTDPTFAANVIVNSFTTDIVDTLNGLSNSIKYYWRVRASNLGVMSAFSTARNFKTVSLPPAVPTLVSPADNAVDLPATVKLICNQAANAAQYNWQVSTSLSFSSFVVNDSTSDTTRIVTGLLANAKYYWQVRAVNPGGASNFAGPDSFTVISIPSYAPALISPVSNAMFQRADTLVLVWNKVAKATGYKVQVSDTVSFARFTENDTTSDSTYTLKLLNHLQKYYWRIAAYNSGGTGSFAPVDSFTTIIAVPATPIIVSPVFNATGIFRKPSFAWRVSPLAETYHFQLATSSQVYRSGDSTGLFLNQNLVFDTTLSASDTTFQLSKVLDSVKIYYWQIAGIDTAGRSSFAIGKFTTSGFITGVVNELSELPTQFNLYQNYPNPFNPSTVIKYSIPKAQFVTLRVYNSIGQEIATLVNTQQNTGFYEVTFDASRFASGVYFYILKTDNFNSIHKMLLLK